MKNLNKLLFAIITVIGIGYITMSCNDKFSEEDLLKLQVQLGNEQDSIKAAQALDALNAAGEMLSFQLKVVDTDGSAIEGLSVTLGAAANGAADNQTLTTDANGLVFFDRVVIGGNLIDISGTNIQDVLLTVDFGQITNGKHYTIIDGIIVPIPVTENAVVTVISTDLATATVQGNVKIETDLTNSTSEVPQDIVLTASFDDNLVMESSISIDYFFATNYSGTLNLGSATVDNATGNYSMTVPAGIDFVIMIPSISTTQRIAVSKENNVDLARPEYRDVDAKFGPDYNIYNFSSQLYYIPNVPGARIVFDAPATPGEGFTFGGMTRVGRSIPNFYLDSGTETITEPREDVSDIVTQFTSLGSGYQSSPDVTITDANGTGATAEAYIEYVTNSITVTTPETGLTPDADYSLNLYYTDVNDVDHFATSLTVTASSTGEITQTEVNAAIALANDNNDSGFGTNWDEINEYSKGMVVVFPGGGNGDGVATTSINGRIHVLDMVNTGSGYTSPSFTFSGGGSSSQAAMNVLQFGTQWTIDVDNSGITTPYPLLPYEMYLEYYEVDDDTRSIYQSYNVENAETFNTIGLDEALVVDGSGNIQWVDQTASYNTDFYAAEMPIPVIVKGQANIAEADIYYYDVDQLTGAVTDIDVNDSGGGYTDRFNGTIEPSAVGAPGSGATIMLTDGEFLTTGEYQWFSDFDVTNGGTGYLRDLNQVNSNSGTGNNYRNYSYSSNYGNLEVGDVKVIDIDYGTGVRSVDFY